MTSSSPLEALRLDIEKVSARIDEVDQELTVAQQSGLAATDSYLRDTLLELRREKNELRKEKNELRQQETILLQAKVPGLAANAFQQLNSNVEVQTQAVLQLGSTLKLGFESIASSLRFAKSAEFVYTPSNASSMRDPNFKLQLIKAYQPSSYDEGRNKPCQTCKCMVLDVSLPTGYVTASHLFKFKWHMRVKEVLGFDNINNIRNGLLLAKPVEEAFDAGYLCFIPDQHGEHRIHLLDSRLSNVKLTDMKHYPWLKPSSQDKMVNEGKQQTPIKDAIQALKDRFSDIPTFATLQGKQLHFEGDQRPFKRCLAFQASQSRHSALSQGRISPLDVPEISGSAWSNNSYLERVKDYLAAPYFEFPSGPMDRLDNISEEE